VYEQPLLFANNDLPGVMLGSGVQRLLHLYGVLPGSDAVVVTANDEGWQVAADLLHAGATVAAVVDRRRTGPSAGGTALKEALQSAGARLFMGSTIVAANGNGAVKEALVAPVGASSGGVERGKARVACDLIAVSVGWAPANGLLYEAGAQIAYREDRGEFVPLSLPPGIFAAGRVRGASSLARQVEEGEQAGRAAAAYAMGREDGLAGGTEETPAPSPENAAMNVSPIAPAAAAPQGRGGKRFVCFCEDVTEKDVQMAIDEGYDSIELLKRYSTISMGPCQGKMCSLNTIHLCARATGRSVAQTGTTTARPPATPVPLGVLAGQHMEPVKETPVHDWHRDHGARMMVAGLWMRPEHYGDPAAEVRAVRQRVGLIDVSTLGKIRLTGPAVPRLLERIYVNRWQKLAPGRVRYGLMCNDEGIVLDDGVTACLAPQEYYMTTTSSGAGAIYEWIQWWAQSGWGDDLHVVPLTDDFAAFNLAGPRARDVLSQLVSQDISNEAFPYMHVRLMDVAGVPCRLLRIGFTGELSYELHCPAAYGQYLWQTLLDAGADDGIMPFGVEAQRILRLEKAHIIVGQDTDALSDPFAAGMAWAVKLDKADFLGRRSLLDVSEDGPASRLTGFKVPQSAVGPGEGSRVEGLQIVERGEDGALQIIGHITSCRFSPTLQEIIGLCWLPTSLVAEGQPFTIRLADGPLLQARVHEGAFYDAEGERLRM
jgi:sarcosine oxidase subunit alpha